MNNKVRIKVETDSYKFINYLVYHGIRYENLIKKNNYYYLNVSYEDYEKINRRYITSIVRYYGINFIVDYFNKHKYLIVSFLICLLLLKLLCNTIFDIKINTDNLELKNEIYKELEKNDISLYKMKKSYDKISKIKENILNEVDGIEWIEINEIGCKYIIDITEKIKDSNIDNNELRDIIASKSGVIKHIVVYRGTKLKEENEYVNKDDLLISGNVYKDEDIIDVVSASGKVYAEVWYKVKIEVPLKYEKRKETGKKVNHYYIEMFNKKYTILGKYDVENVYTENKCILDKPYLVFKLYKEKKIEYENEVIDLDEDSALKIGLEKSDNYFKEKLDNDEYIISKKVLKKEINSSKMYIEIFYKIYENIVKYSEINEKE